MAKIRLPVAQDATGISEALALLRSQKRSALLVERNDQYAVFSVAKLAVGRKQGNKALRDLEPDAIAKSAGGMPTRSPSRGLGAGKASGQPKRKAGAPHSLLMGHVQIRDRELADLYVAAHKDYYCEGPRHHEFPPPDVTEGELCPTGDGFKIVSAQ